MAGISGIGFMAFVVVTNVTLILVEFIACWKLWRYCHEAAAKHEAGQDNGFSNRAYFAFLTILSQKIWGFRLLDPQETPYIP
jgi:high-affinity Fe2+/Pb2+ permease